MRRKTRQVIIGNVAIGGDAPIAVQSMTKVSPKDVAATILQIKAVADAGGDIIRCAVPNLNVVDAFAEIVRQSPLPVVADIHFSCKLAIAAINAGAQKIRINPGNMDNWDEIATVLATAKNAGIPIRIGVNSGSIKHKAASDTRPIDVALAEEALGYATRFEELGFHDIVLSLKTPDAIETIHANRAIAKMCDYPLHLGVTEAGPKNQAMVKSAIGIGALLADGIGDTIRVSYTDSPESEITAAKEILHAAGLLPNRATLISCPTCGRCKTDLMAIVTEVELRLKDIHHPLKVAVMGCEVNGPGEAALADIGIAGDGSSMVLFKHGKNIKSVPYENAVEVLMAEINNMCG